MKSYIRIARVDHWVKNAFILPGIMIGYMLIDHENITLTIGKFILGLLATCLIASANYVINEWLDREFDQYHPTKKLRPAVAGDLKAVNITIEYLLLAIAGIALSCPLGRYFVLTELWLLLMGIVYNVKPLRTKDVIYLDVLSESINNVIRFLLGWFMVTAHYLPPISILIGYWMIGAFLMGAKRLAEYRMIGDPKTASLYRKSFGSYNERTLLVSTFFYAICATFFCGVFLTKYKIEFLLVLPVLFLIFTYYLYLAYEEDSAVQKPEKLYREKKLLILVGILAVMMVALLWIEIPYLHHFVGAHLVTM